MSEAVEDFLASYDDEVREIASQTRALVLAVFPGAIEQLDIPARIIGYGFTQTYAGLVCTIAPHRTYVNLMFAQDTALPDPEQLLEGTGKRARHVKLRSAADIERPTVGRSRKQPLQQSANNGPMNAHTQTLERGRARSRHRRKPSRALRSEWRLGVQT